MPLSSESAAKIESLVRHAMEDSAVPGIAVGLTRSDESIYRHGFGVQSIVTNRPVGPDTIFKLASLSKPFTATAVMQLAEQGLLELSAPVAAYLHEFRNATVGYDRITVWQLLTHTSGMSSFAPGSLVEWWQSLPIEFDAEAYDRHVAAVVQGELEHQPGETFAYSDVGYDMLGAIVGRTSESSFEEYVHYAIFAPLGMESSTFLLAETNPERLAQPHYADASGQLVIPETFPYTRRQAPSCELFSTVDDLLRWLRYLLTKGQGSNFQLLAPASLDLMWVPHVETGWGTPQNRGVQHYGCGWFIGEMAGMHSVSHAGGDLGFNAFMALLPSVKLGIVVMGNRLDQVRPPWYALELAATILDEVR